MPLRVRKSRDRAAPGLFAAGRFIFLPRLADAGDDSEADENDGTDTDPDERQAQHERAIGWQEAEACAPGRPLCGGARKSKL